MPITSNAYNYTLRWCQRLWDGVFNLEQSNVINFLPDGTIYVSNDDLTNGPYNITQTCCNILRDRLLAQNPPQYPTNVDPNNIYFDLNEQKCRWSTPSNESCVTPDKEIKIVLNPVGNDGAFFTLTENDTCRLEIKFDYLFKIKCKTLEEVINVTPVTYLKPATDLRQEYFKKESELLDVNIQLEGLSKQAASTPYSIICNDFPTNQEVASAKPTTEITQTQKLPFLNTGFGSLTNNTELSVSTTKVAPIYETKPVNFCLTDTGLLSWRNIIGENNYVDFINGQPDSYTCLDVIEIDKLNEEAIITNNERLIFECTTPFGEKTTLLNKISELITVQKTLTNEISTVDAKIKAIGEVENPCSTMLGQFENLNARVTLDMVDGNNVTMENIFFSTFFDVGQNLYSYLNSNQNNSGFFVCGEPSNNETWASGCTGLVYPEFTFGGTVEDSNELNVSICNNVKDILYQELYNSSGAQTQQDFNDSLSPNVFNSNWLTYTNTINTTSGFTNNQIKLNIIVNSPCDNFCLLIDQISLTKVCDDTNRTNIFISQSPGFEITRVIDNKKSWLQSDSYTERDFYIARYDDVNKIRQTEYSVDDDRLILNSKEIDLTVNMASAVENDVWCYLLDNPNLLTGSTSDAGNGVLSDCPPPCCLIKQKCGDKNVDFTGFMTTNITEVNTLETFENLIISELTDAKNRKTLSGYPTLKAVYDRYLNATQLGVPKSNEFTYEKMDEFTGLIKTYWDDLIEQVVPATTLWGSVKVYTNTMFDQQKFKYRSYTSLFCSEPEYTFQVPFNVPSPINGNDGLCQNVEVTTLNLEVFPSDLQFIRRLVQYNKICLSQMNYGSEFIGNVDIMGPNGQDINSDNFCMPVPLCPNCVEGAITIGTQTWDKCNLNVDTYSDGTPIPQVTGATAWSALTTGAWCYYDNDPANGAVYGKLYNWYAVAGIWDEASKTDVSQRKSLAPIGKNMPTDSEWATLITYLGGSQIAGGKLKEDGYCHWFEPNTAATNEYGFTALPGGARYDLENSPFLVSGSNGYWWTSTESPILTGCGVNYNMYATFAGALQVNTTTKKTGLSVRCLTKIPTPTPTLVTCCGEVTIGTQTWDVCNANVETYSDGTPIPQVTDPTEWANLTTGAWCYYNNDPDSEAVYGKMYNWYAAAGIYDAASLANPALRKSLAPVGKSVPTDAQWTTLTTFLGGTSVAGGKLKEVGFCHWLEPNTAATDEYGFTALPGGLRQNIPATFSLVRYQGFYWTITQASTTRAWGRILSYSDGIVVRADGDKESGISVRFIKN